MHTQFEGGIRLTPHSTSVTALLKELNTTAEIGLSEQEAQNRLAQHGENKLKEKKKKTNLPRFFDQFKDVMILILIAAAIISFAIACVNGQPEEFFEPALIMLIVILNAVMGVMQESKVKLFAVNTIQKVEHQVQTLRFQVGE